MTHSSCKSSPSCCNCWRASTTSPLLMLWRLRSTDAFDAHAIRRACCGIVRADRNRFREPFSTVLGSNLITTRVQRQVIPRQKSGYCVRIVERNNAYVLCASVRGWEVRQFVIAQIARQTHARVDNRLCDVSRESNWYHVEIIDSRYSENLEWVADRMDVLKEDRGAHSSNIFY